MSTKKKNVLREYIEAFAVALLAVFILRIFVVQAFRIPTGSMKNTLLIGDFLLVNKFVYGAKTPDHIPIVNASVPSLSLPALITPKRGDIIVFKYPLDERLDYIKRCIAVPGDTIAVRNGNAFINGRPEGTYKLVRKEYDPTEPPYYFNIFRVTTPDSLHYNIRRVVNANLIPQRDFGPEVVPPGHYFMMGDNRDNSQDSRYWGFMPEENIVGKPMVIYFSWDKTKPIWDLYDKIRWARIFRPIR